MDNIKVEGKTLKGKARAAYDAFVAAKQQEADAKKAKEQAQKILFEFLDGDKVAYIGKVVVLKVTPGKNTRFDRDVMAKSFPEALATCLRETHYEYIKVV